MTILGSPITEVVRGVDVSIATMSQVAMKVMRLHCMVWNGKQSLSKRDVQGLVVTEILVGNRSSLNNHCPIGGNMLVDGVDMPEPTFIMTGQTTTFRASYTGHLPSVHVLFSLEGERSVHG